jgi:TP901-1 family phage major tail protein
MSKEAGTNVLLKVSAGSPTSFATLAGQQVTEMTGPTETDDITDKDQQGWGSTLNVLRRMTINVRGKADWPDTTGLDIIRNAWENGTDVECQVVLNSSNSNYIGNFTVSSFNISGGFNNATEYNVTLENNGVMTYSAT